MLKSYLRRQIERMEHKFAYDAAYAREILDASMPAFLKFALFQAMAAHRDGVPREAWFAAKLAAVMKEDCGPCAQLVLDTALQAGVRPQILAALVRQDFPAAGRDAALGFRYGLAVSSNTPDAAEIAAEAQAKFGKRGQVSLAMAVASARVYPTLKRAMGHGAVCRRLSVLGDAIPVCKVA
jgi:hypothetical protein